MRRSVLLCALLIALVGTSLAPADALAQSSCIDPGSDVPVVFVHGLLGEGKDWTESSGDGYQLFTRVNSMDGFVADTFDYGGASDQWIDDPRIGPMLAERIVCLSDAAGRNTGRPKVVLVGHSMGGLAIRYAVGQPGMADRVGLVVTIGTPHEGSWLDKSVPYRGSTRPVFGVVNRPLERLVWTIVGGLCEGQHNELCELVRYADTDAAPAMVQGSRELTELPTFPRSLPVLAVAGDIHVSVPWFKGTLTVFPMGDMVVSVESATSPAAHTELGGGRKIVSCEVLITEVSIADLVASTSPCLHVGKVGDGLLSNEQAMNFVVTALQKWRATGATTTVKVPRPLSDHGITFDGVTVYVPESSWCPPAYTLEPCMFEEDSTSAFMGSCGSGGCVGLMLYTNFTGSLDRLAPASLVNEQCGDWAYVSTAVNARVLDARPQAIAGVLGQFRRWEISCEEGGRVLYLRAWADLSRRIAFLETYEDPNHAVMVATARIVR